MARLVVTWLASNAEDLSLAAGTICVSIGTGIAYGFAFGLIAFGALAIAYGVWITRGVS